VKPTYWLFVSLFVVMAVQAADEVSSPKTPEVPASSEVMTPANADEASSPKESVPVSSEVVTPANEAHGKELHNPECITSCHTPKSYVSENRKVKDFAHLNTFVQMCATNLNKSWFEEDVADVANYLNTEYYKFPVE